MICLQNQDNKHKYKHAKDRLKCFIHQSVKIGEKGGQVTKNRKTGTYRQVWHPYMLMHAISNKTMHMKIVDLIFMNEISLKPYKNTTYNIRYNFTTKIVQTDDHTTFKNR